MKLDKPESKHGQDKEANQNLLAVHYTVFHFDILGDKIWIQENRTDVKIDEELVEAGVAKEDIFSGMMHPEMRRLVKEARA